MARKVGTFKRQPDGTIKARFTFRDNLNRVHRPWIDLPGSLSDADAEETLAAIAKQADGQIYDPKRWKRAAELSTTPTVSEYVSKLWMPARADKIKSQRQDISRWKNHLEPLIGHLKMSEVTPDHLRAVVEVLDDKAANNEGFKGRDFGEKTAINCWAVVRAIFRDATKSKRRELRVLDRNPALEVTGPDSPEDIEKQWLFPVELQQLLSCSEVALWRRRRYAACVYLFCRPGELIALLWGSGIDLTHGLVRINRAWDRDNRRFNEYTKTGDHRHFAIEPLLLPMLEAMRAESPDAVEVFSTAGNLARQLREDLWTAGIRRPALHTKTKGSRMMRFHDLRATGITYLALRGDTDNQVRERAGHTDFKTTLEYIRRGQHAAGARMGDPFAPLPAELLGTHALSASGAPSGEGTAVADLPAVTVGYAPGVVGCSPSTHAPTYANPAEKPPLADAYKALRGLLDDAPDANETERNEREDFSLALLECGPGAHPPARPLSKTRPAYIARKRSGGGR